MMKNPVPRLLHRFFRKAGIRIDLLKIRKVYSRHPLPHSLRSLSDTLGRTACIQHGVSFGVRAAFFQNRSCDDENGDYGTSVEKQKSDRTIILSIMSMIKNLVLVCLGSLIPLLAFPQGKKMNIQEALAKYGAKSFRGVPHLDEFSPLWWGKSEVETVDSTRLEVVYDLKYRRAHRVGNYWEMLTILQVGTVWQKYYSLIRQFTDDIQREVSGVAKGIAPVPGVGYQHQYTEEELHLKEIAGKDFMNCEIWVERPIRRLTERAHAFDKANVSIEYEEPVPMIEWQLTEKTDTIAGCVCFLATTHFRGRDWNVWFDPTIPINSGPWKLNGLPGLVLKAEDTEQDYIWTCQSITQERKPIVYYKVEQQLMTRKKWQRYFRQVHEDPVTVLGDGGNYLFFHGNNLIQKEDSWTLPYNPIELE